MKNYRILNPNAPLSKECHKCGYLNPEAKSFYKCAVPGTCPAFPAGLVEYKKGK